MKIYSLLKVAWNKRQDKKDEKVSYYWLVLNTSKNNFYLRQFFFIKYARLQKQAKIEI